MPSGSLNVSTEPYSRSTTGVWVTPSRSKWACQTSSSAAVVDQEAHVVEAGTGRVERLALVGVVLLELDDRRGGRVNAAARRAIRPLDLVEVDEVEH